MAINPQNFNLEYTIAITADVLEEVRMTTPPQTTLPEGQEILPILGIRKKSNGLVLEFHCEGDIKRMKRRWVTPDRVEIFSLSGMVHVAGKGWDYLVVFPKPLFNGKYMGVFVR